MWRGRLAKACVILVLAAASVAARAQEPPSGRTDVPLAETTNATGPATLSSAVGEACKTVASGLAKEVPFTSTCGDPPLEGAAATACRESLVKSLVDGVEEELKTRAGASHADLLTEWDRRGRSIDALQPLLQLGDDFDAAVKDTVDLLEERSEQRFDAIDFTKTTAKGTAQSVWTELVDGASRDFVDRCRGDLVPRLVRALALQSLRKGAEAEHFQDLTKKDGFSPVVRCQWMRVAGEIDRLECTPGLRLSGQDAAAIQILPPLGEEGFRLAWLQAITAEEGKRVKGAVTVCPGFSGPDPRKLACDELCFSRPPSAFARLCSGANDMVTATRVGPLPFRFVPAQAATIAVHLPRMIDTSYGCLSSSTTCALERLRGLPTTGVQREKLSLLLSGKTPYIGVHAIDSNGRLATGTVLVGYERWRVETGGFLAISPLVDEEPVQLTASEDGTVVIDGDTLKVGEGQIAVRRIREADEWSQETGIFVNFIPRNYETFGIGFGLATHDGSAPSVYLGPVFRLRSFGHRGLASFSGGVVLREVDRFPDFEPGVYDADSSFLQPDSRFDHDWFFGIQLGFSFGSISVPGAGDE